MSESARVIGSGPYVRVTLRQKGVGPDDETRAQNHYLYFDLDGDLSTAAERLRAMLSDESGTEVKPFRSRFVSRGKPRKIPPKKKE